MYVILLELKLSYSIVASKIQMEIVICERSLTEERSDSDYDFLLSVNRRFLGFP